MALSMWQACQEGNLAEMMAAIQRGEDVNRKMRNSLTGLMTALRFAQNPLVRLFLAQSSVDLNCTDSLSRSALHWAAEYDNAEGVQLLLDDPRLTTASHKDNCGRTPVMKAMFYNRVNALRKLVAHPCVDLNTRDNYGRSLEQVARQVFKLIETR